MFCSRPSCGLILFDPRKSTAAQRSALRRRSHTTRDKKVAYLLRRDGPSCGYCGVEFSANVPATLDHRVPRCRGGHSRYSNLILACGWCNHRKGHMDEADFRASAVLAERRRHLMRVRNRAMGLTNSGLGFWHPDVKVDHGTYGCLICGRTGDARWPLAGQPCLLSVRED